MGRSETWLSRVLLAQLLVHAMAWALAGSDSKTTMSLQISHEGLYPSLPSPSPVCPQLEAPRIHYEEASSEAVTNVGAGQSRRGQLQQRQKPWLT